MKSIYLPYLFIPLFIFSIEHDALAQLDSSLTSSVETILELYKTNDVVLFSESHGNKEIHDFLELFISYPKTAEVIDDIVVEFGNAMYQNIADRYVLGENISIDSLALIWRNHTVPFTWDSPLYEKFFKVVRAANMNRSDGKKLRVLLGDPPIDWSKVNTGNDYELSLSKRDIHPYELIKEAIITKGRKGFVIIGGAHILPVDLRTGLPNKNRQKATLAQLLKDSFPNQIFGIWVFSGTNEERISMGLDEAYDFKHAKEQGLRGKSFQLLYGDDTYVAEESDGERRWVPLAQDKWVKIDQAVDGVLYLGPNSTTVEADESIYTEYYLKELERRVRIIDDFFGFDLYQNQLNRIRGE